MTNLYNFGAEMLRTHGNIHGALRELMIDFQLDGYKPDSTIPNATTKQHTGILQRSATVIGFASHTPLISLTLWCIISKDLLAEPVPP